MVASRLIRGLLAMLIVAIAVMTRSNPVQAGASGCVPDIGKLGKRVPIVLVHGLASSRSVWGNQDDPASMMHALNELPSVYVDDPPFDYSKYNQEWVDNPNIGPALAQRIVCLALSSRQAGGTGKVIAIGHSMGGLAIRYAATKTPEASEVTRDLGLVITIATPNIGSAIGNGASGILRDVVCKAHGFGRYVSENNPCVLSAINGLRDNSQELKDLPWLPSSIPVLAIAGDVTITYPLLFMTLIPLVSKQDTKTDLIVSTKSALKGMAHPEVGGGQGTLSCSVSIRVIDLVARLILQHTFLPPCWHSALPHNRTVEEATVNAIKKYLQTPTSTTIPGIEPFVGTWGVGGVNYLIIKADGSATYQVQVRGETAQIQFTRVRGNTTYGMVTSGIVDAVGYPGNSIPTGGNIAVTLIAPKSMQVSNGGLFCQPSDQCAY